MENNSDCYDAFQTDPYIRRINLLVYLFDHYLATRPIPMEKLTKQLSLIESVVATVPELSRQLANAHLADVRKRYLKVLTPADEGFGEEELNSSLLSL